MSYTEGNNQVLAWMTLKSGKTDLDLLFVTKLEEMYNLYLRKNADYGTDNIRMGGIEGIVLRMGDKISRLWKLIIQRKAAEIGWETSYDTLIDLANYAVLGAALLEKGKSYDMHPDNRITTASYIRSLPKEEKQLIIRALLED